MVFCLATSVAAAAAAVLPFCISVCCAVAEWHGEEEHFISLAEYDRSRGYSHVPDATMLDEVLLLVMASRALEERTYLLEESWVNSPMQRIYLVDEWLDRLPRERQWKPELQPDQADTAEKGLSSMASWRAISVGICVVVWRFSQVDQSKVGVRLSCSLFILLPLQQYCAGFFAPFGLWERAQHSTLSRAYGFACGPRREVFDAQAHPDDHAIAYFILQWKLGWITLAQWKCEADHGGWQAVCLGITLDMHF
mmetsp:Transcript_465/g.1084  ORF Transcript_465/g.1084 Transcript_465/m.1084 type:complete len:252 (-) Transcript_465:222-977(-)